MNKNNNKKRASSTGIIKLNSSLTQNKALNTDFLRDTPQNTQASPQKGMRRLPSSRKANTSTHPWSTVGRQRWLPESKALTTLGEKDNYFSCPQDSGNQNAIPGTDRMTTGPKDEGLM